MGGFDLRTIFRNKKLSKGKHQGEIHRVEW